MSRLVRPDTVQRKPSKVSGFEKREKAWLIQQDHGTERKQGLMDSGGMLQETRRPELAGRRPGDLQFLSVDKNFEMFIQSVGSFAEEDLVAVEKIIDARPTVSVNDEGSHFNLASR
jgi:hypothetical protein